MYPFIQFHVFSLFPEVLEPYLQASILQRAQQNQLIGISLHNIRDWSKDRHHITDDLPYGGGGGMVMKPEPIFAAVEAVLGTPPAPPVILLTPQGRLFTQEVTQELCAPALTRLQPKPSAQALEDLGQPTPTIALICGRYEGFDERIRQSLVTDEISIGDYVITGGELAALVVIDAVSRLLPGVLGDPDGAYDDSHSTGLLEYPHYTRPVEFRGMRTLGVLLSGDHAQITRWGREQQLLRTARRRPDMLAKADLSESDRRFLASQDPALIDKPERPVDQTGREHG